MSELGNSIQNNALAAFKKQAPKGVIEAIGAASAKTGVDFAYLMQQAKAESSFNPTAKAKTSSATGLFQFIDSTWMNMVERYGDKHGINSDGKSKQEILNLRKDPEIASNMAAEFASENEKFLEDNWAKGKKDIGPTELYFAHFMGAGGAAGFLNARDENPFAAAADIFPRAASANKNVFYDPKSGEPRSLDQVYAFFDKKFSIKSEELVPKTPEVESVIYKDKPKAQNSEIYLTGSLFQSSHNQRDNFFAQPYAPSTATNRIPPAYQSLVNSPIDIMLLAQLDLPTKQDIKRH